MLTYFRVSIILWQGCLRIPGTRPLPPNLNNGNVNFRTCCWSARKTLIDLIYPPIRNQSHNPGTEIYIKQEPPLTNRLQVCTHGTARKTSEPYTKSCSRLWERWMMARACICTRKRRLCVSAHMTQRHTAGLAVREIHQDRKRRNGLARVFYCVRRHS